MKRLVLLVLLMGCVGCSTWAYVQPGKTERDARRDENECRTQIGSKYGGWDRVDVFTKASELKDCMDLKGYKYQPVS